VDKVEITVKAGDGGNGVATFKHEKYIPLGGPDGGDGGDGGSIYMVGDRNTNDLSLFRHKRSFKATDGLRGSKQKKHGKRGEDLEITVPLGTTVYKIVENSEKILADIIIHGQKAMAAKGGRGGLGNIHFATSTNQAPKKATNGQFGEKFRLLLDLKLIADVGIIGYPSVGKSTLLAAISSARPKIADYHFTTLEPVLGMVRVEDQSLTFAEIPGLIADAHLGKGLGHEFLRHAERTRLFLHLIDGSSGKILENYNSINMELSLFKAELASNPQIVAVNKVDLPEVQGHQAVIKELFKECGISVYFVSGKTKQGIPELLRAIYKALKLTAPPAEEPVKVFHPKPRDR
jgi:GTPase